MRNNQFKFYVSVFIGLSILSSCGSSDDPAPANCDSPPFVSVVNISATSTCAAQDGSVTVEAAGGVSPYEYSIDGGTSFQSSGVFADLAVGAYTVIVTDVNGCSGEVSFSIESSGTDLAATVNTTEDTQCFQNNGTLEVNATGGNAPYEYNIGDGFVTSNNFGSLAPGSYEIIVKDAGGCTVAVSAEVPRGDTGTSYANDINPIIMNSCAITGCHNGDNGADKDWTDFSLLQSKADLVKERTQNGSMPQTGSLTAEEIALIACWVDEGAKDN